MLKLLRPTLLLLFILGVSPNLLQLVSNQLVNAQSATATLSVTIVDSNGDAIPAANITVSNLRTRAHRETLTNLEGRATLTQLPPGNYSITANKQGFESAERSDVVLSVNDLLSVRVELKVGEVKAAVQVSSMGSSHNESSAVSTVVDQKFVENLPLNGRSFNALMELTPGTVLAASQYSDPGQFSVNGQRQNANYFMIDGVSANVGISGGPQLEQTSNGSVPAYTAFGGTNGLISEDAMQEFRIQTSTYAPEFGRSSGAQVSIVSRSGSNSFHGKVFDYLRNEALDANDWFANRLGLRKAKLRQNDFGGVLGGPLHRDRTFFFFSYEGLRLLLPNVYDSVVPSVSARQSAIPAMQTFLNAFPIPNGTNFGNGLAQFAATYSSPSTLDATSIRVDHIVNSKLNLFGRYNYAPSDTSLRGAFFGVSVSQISRASSTPNTLTIGAQLITPHLINDLRFNYSRVRANIEYLLDDFGGAVPPSTTSITPSSSTTPTSVHQLSFGQSFLLLGRIADNYQRQINIVDNVTTSTGSHQFGFGFDYRRLTPVSAVHEYDFSTFFNGINAAIAGQAAGVTIRSSFGRMYPVFNNFSAYAQDTWRVKRRLTLTYGVRWELNPAPHEAKGNDPFTVQGLDQLATTTLAPRGTPLWKTTYGNFAPRFGVVYLLNNTPGRETVLRGGFGIFYDMGNGAGAQAIFGSNYPNTGTKFLNNVQFPLTQSQLAPPAFSATPPYGTLFVADPNLVLPRTYQWNISGEQSLGNPQTISVSYVGALGRKLLRRELVVPNPLFSEVHVTRNTATSDYHALQIQFQRRLTRGLQALGSYTWSHSIDIASSEGFLSTTSISLDPKTDRGPSDFDVRQSLAGAITYDLPTPGRGSFVRAVLGHWSFDSILRLRSATPINVVDRPVVGDLFGVFFVKRPNRIVDVPLYLHDETAPGGKVINRLAFASAPAGQQGSLGRNAVRGFPVSQVDLALRRQFAVGEQLKLQFRVELFNLFNHPNFAPPVAVFGRPTFGRSQSMLNKSLGIDATGLNPLYQLGGPRSIQLALKLEF